MTFWAVGRSVLCHYPYRFAYGATISGKYVSMGFMYMQAFSIATLAPFQAGPVSSVFPSTLFPGAVERWISGTSSSPFVVVTVGWFCALRF